MSVLLDQAPVVRALRFEGLCRVFADASPIPMAAIDRENYVFRYSNSAFDKLLGLPNEKILGKTFCDVFGGSESFDAASVFERVLATGQAEQSIEMTRNREATAYWSVSFWELREGESSLGLVVQIIDLTDTMIYRKRSMEMNESLLTTALRQHELTEIAEKLNADLQTANQAKSQFLAVMSHEIRTPLNAIMGFSDLLTHSDQSESQRQMFASRLKRNSQLLLRLIDDILDLSKVEAGKIEMETIEFNLAEILSDLEMIMRHMADEKGIAFTLTHDGLLPTSIVSDPTRLKQILSNIIGNSIKFTGKGAVSVQVKADVQNQVLTFRVQDTGIGMNEEDIQKLFQSFTQGNATMTRKFGGTGLGLDLSRRLARNLGGDVTLLRSVKDEGSVFEIKIALVDPKFQEANDETMSKLAQDDVRLDGVKILLAEDAPDNQFLISHYLSAAGAIVVIAPDGEVAINEAMATHYDIVLMDIQMPKVDGYTATRILRKKGFKDPVLALTAHAMRGEAERCRLAGCDVHLAKPVGPIDLIHVVHKLLAERSRSIPQSQDHSLLN